MSSATERSSNNHRELFEKVNRITSSAAKVFQHFGSLFNTKCKQYQPLDSLLGIASKLTPASPASLTTPSPLRPQSLTPVPSNQARPVPFPSCCFGLHFEQPAPGYHFSPVSSLNSSHSLPIDHFPCFLTQAVHFPFNIHNDL